MPDYNQVNDKDQKTATDPSVGLDRAIPARSGQREKEKYRRYDSKRLGRPMINAVRDVPEETIEKLGALSVHDGSKKAAILKAIDDRFEKVFKDK